MAQRIVAGTAISASHPTPKPATALVELNPEKLKERIETAHAAIEARFHELTQRNQKASEEWQALHDALAGLAVLRREITRRDDN